MKVTLTPLADIHPAPWNVRTGHDVDGIAESIRINGFRDPIEVWRETGEIVAGEGRYHAAKALELDQVPVIYHDFTGMAEAKRYGIANNRFTDLSDWDVDALGETLRELDSLAGTGFEQYRQQIDAEADAAVASGVDLDADEAADSGPAERYPLAIVLDLAERREWDACKEALDERDDKAALLALVRGAA